MYLSIDLIAQRHLTPQNRLKTLSFSLSTIWTDEKQTESQKRKSEKTRRKKMQVREKVGKSRTAFFQCFVAQEGRQIALLKRRVRSQLARWKMKKCTPLWRNAHLEVKSVKTTGFETLSKSSDVEKVHAVVTRSPFPSQNVQIAPGSHTALMSKSNW